MYKIKIEYETGSECGSHDETKHIEYEWNNIDRAKESLVNIKNHNEFYLENSYTNSKPKCKLPTGVQWDNEYRMIVLILVDDSGKDFRYSSFWTGYFENLQWATIEPNDETMIYEP